MITTTPELRALLRDCRVHASFSDVTGRRRRASIDSRLALLQSLGIDIDSPRQAGEFLNDRRQQRARRGIEPVMAAWNGRSSSADLTLPASPAVRTVSYEIDPGRDRIDRHYHLDNLSRVDDRNDVPPNFITYRLPLPSRLPWGYHRLRLDAAGRSFETLIISTPRRAYRRDGADGHDLISAGSPNGDVSDNGNLSRRRRSKSDQPRREWGSFLPLYALRTDKDWGAGDFGGLRELVDWTAELRGSAVGTLPLFSAFLDEPYEPSPYRPASRLFWNEFYLDVSAIPELAHNEKARELIASSEFRQRIAAQRAGDFVNYREVMQLKREALVLLAREFFANRPPRFAEFQRFLSEHPAVQDYARFRAAVDKQRAGWPSWPRPMRDGQLRDSDYDPSTVEYYLYAQWIASEQLASMHQHAAAVNCGLYLDLPVGVDPASYDVWRHQSQYLSGVTIGAPPDPVYTKGQDWGLPPLHPERIREDGYGLFRRVLEANMKFARYLRIDHVMGLARVYCIPPGFSADDGAYLHYRADEMFAILVLESHRNRCAVMGENLGTVPREVDLRIKRHGIGGMWVAPYELEPGRREVLNAPPPGSVASLNTHDMPPFAAWRRADEVADRQALGLIDAETAQRERDERREQVKKLVAWLRSVGALEDSTSDESRNGQDEALLAALLKSIADSPADLVLLNLEDLWLETRPQNFPGTSHERPNWSRKARLSLEELRELRAVRDLLQDVNKLRQGKPKPR